MAGFNRGRSMINCPPDCPKREPGCQDRCGQYKAQKAAHEQRKTDVYGDPDVRQYFKDKRSERRDMKAKKDKERRNNRNSRYN